jgi:hypothetical protein
MFWFNHRRQAGSRKPVAVLVQRHADKPSTLTLDSPLPDLPTLQGAQGNAPASDPLQFSVRYALPEYVSFMWQHGGYLIRRRRMGRAATCYLLAKSTSAAAFHFVAQGRSRNTYEFTIDAHGIIRASRSGVTLIPWADVSAIRTYSRGFLMVLKRGTLPLPFRCLSAEQSGAIVKLAASVRRTALR